VQRAICFAKIIDCAGGKAKVASRLRLCLSPAPLNLDAKHLKAARVILDSKFWIGLHSVKGQSKIKNLKFRIRAQRDKFAEACVSETTKSAPAYGANKINRIG
jgi:hypothetical protein